MHINLAVSLKMCVFFFAKTTFLAAINIQSKTLAKTRTFCKTIIQTFHGKKIVTLSVHMLTECFDKREIAGMYIES